MQYYELTYFISSELNTEEVGKFAQEINSFIQSKEGIIAKSENPVPSTLAYIIKKQKAGFLVNLGFYLTSEKIEELRKKLEKETKILRFLLIAKKLPKKATIEEKPKREKPEKKVELKEIEKKLEEILEE